MAQSRQSEEVLIYEEEMRRCRIQFYKDNDDITRKMIDTYLANKKIIPVALFLQRIEDNIQLYKLDGQKKEYFRYIVANLCPGVLIELVNKEYVSKETQRKAMALVEKIESYEEWVKEVAAAKLKSAQEWQRKPTIDLNKTHEAKKQQPKKSKLKKIEPIETNLLKSTHHFFKRKTKARLALSFTPMPELNAIVTLRGSENDFKVYEDPDILSINLKS